MDRCPVELWLKIFAIACTDDGFTGRSLSLVSRYIRDTSKSFKLQSVAICGLRQTVEFAALVTKTPRCHARHLYICDGTCRSHADDNERSVDAHTRQEALSTSISTIIAAVSPTLWTLSLYGNLSWVRPVALRTGPNTFLPFLTDLTIQCDGLYAHEDGHQPDASFSSFPTLPSLRYLNIPSDLPASDLLANIPHFAPYLTHIRLPGMLYSGLERALNLIRRPDEEPVSQFPQTMEKVYIHTEPLPIRAGSFHVLFSRSLSFSQWIAAKDDRVVLLQATPHLVGRDLCHHLKREWLDRIDGGNGCWDETLRDYLADYYPIEKGDAYWGTMFTNGPLDMFGVPAPPPVLKAPRLPYRRPSIFRSLFKRRNY